MNRDRAAELRDWASRLLADHQARATARPKRAEPQGGTWLVQHRVWNKRADQEWQPYVRPRRHTQPAVQPPTKRGSRRSFRLTKRQSRDFDLAQVERDRRHRMRMARMLGPA